MPNPRISLSPNRLILAISSLLSMLMSNWVLACGEDLSQQQLQQIGQQIFINECNAQVRCLVDWNPGEEFPSLGIGHFIWYPSGVNAGFTESFPMLINFLKQQGPPLPQWLNNRTPFTAPWDNREQFLQQADGELATSLRVYLQQTQSQQTAFMLQRMQTSLQRIINSTPSSHQHLVRHNIQRLCQHRNGIYPLIDYVNFKGEGISATETYHGQGWGLRQVLMEMQADGNPAQQFGLSAAKVLTQRAENASNPMEKRKWLKGWKIRLQTYNSFPD